MGVQTATLREWREDGNDADSPSPELRAKRGQSAEIAGPGAQKQGQWSW